MDGEMFGLVTREKNPIPLTGVDVHAKIAGRGARVRVRQSFRNSEERPIEAIYKFPLPENSSVCGFRVLVDGKLIEGEIEERDKAFELYDKALEKGDGGFLVDEERPNIFTLSVGNLKPGHCAAVEISYVQLLDADKTGIRFSLPTTISPRYTPVTMPDREGIPESEHINPVYDFMVPYGLNILVEIEERETMSSIESPSHAVKTTFHDDRAIVEFASGTAEMDHDFVLSVVYKEEFKTRAVVESNGNNLFLQVDFVATKDGQADLPQSPRPNKEIVFLLDCSGSMNGITTAIN